MQAMPTLESSVQQLKSIIRSNDGGNVADSAFVRRVDDLISVFYDDIGEIKNVSIKSLFDLFVIKVLYIGRRSRDAAVIDYLGDLLSRYLFTRELFPIQRDQRRALFYFSNLLEEMRGITSRFQNLFEAYRKYADNALFITGIFPRALHGGGRRYGRLGRRSADLSARGWRPIAFVDRTYYVSTGKECYRLAAEHELADLIQQRPMLQKLSAYFEVYMEAFNEMSERYILGFDMNLIADKMLDNFNLYRRTGEGRYLDNARKYAALLKVDAAHFPKLFRRTRAYIL